MSPAVCIFPLSNLLFLVKGETINCIFIRKVQAEHTIYDKLATLQHAGIGPESRVKCWNACWATRKLLTWDLFLCFSGVIVQTNKDGSLPSHVLYKIRQNSSFTEKTNEIRRAYWRPGPNTGGKFYFLYGFVWIQGKWPKCFASNWIECIIYRSIFDLVLLLTWSNLIIS